MSFRFFRNVARYLCHIILRFVDEREDNQSKLNSTMKTENLGRANCNPLNIRYAAANHWLGLHPTQPNVKGFCRFISVAHGYRAAVVLMKRYINRYGLDTPRKIIYRWAPPVENNTVYYIAAVCGRSGLHPDEHLSPTGPQLGRLIAAMARQETGMHITPEGIDVIRSDYEI